MGVDAPVDRRRDSFRKRSNHMRSTTALHFHSQSGEHDEEERPVGTITVDVRGVKGFPDFILCLQQRLVGLNIVRGATKFLAATSMPMRLNSTTTKKRVKPAHGLKIVWNREKDAAPNEKVTTESFPRQLEEWPKNDNMPTLELR